MRIEIHCLLRRPAQANAKALTEDKLGTNDAVSLDSIEKARKKAAEKASAEADRLQEARNDGLADEEDDPIALEDQHADPFAATEASFSARNTRTSTQKKKSQPSEASIISPRESHVSLSEGRKRASSTGGSERASKASKKAPKGATGKVSELLPRIKEEYASLMEAFGKGEVKADIIKEKTTSWGRSKGGLLSQQMGDEADEVQSLCTKLSKVSTMIKYCEAFDEQREVANANKFSVALSNMDESIKRIMPDKHHTLQQVALALIDAIGGHLVAAAQRLRHIKRDDAFEEESLRFWKKWANAKFSKYSTRGTRFFYFPESLEVSVGQFWGGG